LKTRRDAEKTPSEESARVAQTEVLDRTEDAATSTELIVMKLPQVQLIATV